jgi:putative endonuclease
MHYSYIIKSLKDAKCYYGHTLDIQRRLKDHNNGKVRSTKGRRPFEIIYSEEFETKSEATKRELFYKSIDGYNWLKEKNIL